MTNDQIIKAIKQGDSELYIKVLYKKTLPIISNYIKRRGGTEQDAYDCFQESLLVLIEKVKRNSFDNSYPVSNFLFGVARNFWKRENQRKNKLVYDGLDKDIKTEEDQRTTITPEKRSVLKSLIESIGEKCAKLIHLMIYENKKYEDILNEAGYNNVNVAKASYYRCKEKLRKLVTESTVVKNILNDA